MWGVNVDRGLVIITGGRIFVCGCGEHGFCVFPSFYFKVGVHWEACRTFGCRLLLIFCCLYRRFHFAGRLLTSRYVAFRHKSAAASQDRRFRARRWHISQRCLLTRFRAICLRGVNEVTFQFIGKVRSGRASRLYRNFCLGRSQRGEFLQRVSLRRELINNGVLSACSVINAGFGCFVCRLREVAIQRGFASTICVRCEFTIAVVDQYLGFIRTSFFPRLANGLVISYISKANNSSATFSQFASWDGVASCIRRLIANAFVQPGRQFVVSVARLINVRIEGSRCIHRLIVTFLQRFAFMSGSYVIRIATFCRSNERGELCFTGGSRDATNDRFIFRFVRVFGYDGLIESSYQIVEGRCVRTGVLVQRCSSEEANYFVARFSFEFSSVGIFSDTLFFYPCAFCFLCVVLYAAIRGQGFQAVRLSRTIVGTRYMGNYRAVLCNACFSSIL